MTIVSARWLIVAYAALLALFDLSVLLPGNPYSSRGEFVAAVAVQTLIVWRLWHRSSLAWLVAMAFAAGDVVTTLLMQPGLEVGVILTFVLSFAQAAILAILWTRPTKAFGADKTSALEPSVGRRAGSATLTMAFGPTRPP
jgi:hypothetical protein